MWRIEERLRSRWGESLALAGMCVAGVWRGGRGGGGQTSDDGERDRTRREVSDTTGVGPQACCQGCCLSSGGRGVDLFLRKGHRRATGLAAKQPYSTQLVLDHAHAHPVTDAIILY